MKGVEATNYGYVFLSKTNEMEIARFLRSVVQSGCTPGIPCHSRKTGEKNKEPWLQNQTEVFPVFLGVLSRTLVTGGKNDGSRPTKTLASQAEQQELDRSKPRIIKRFLPFQGLFKSDVFA